MAPTTHAYKIIELIYPIFLDLCYMKLYHLKSSLILSFILSFSFSVKLKAQNNQTTEADNNVKNVEKNLMSWVITGSDSVWTLDERMKFYGIHGVSIAVVNDYKIQWAKGYGYMDKHNEQPVTTETLFQAASISKAINTMGIIKLYQDGKVDLYKDINTYLTSWKFPYEKKHEGKPVNLANLLSHTSGITAHNGKGFPGYEKGKNLPTIPQILNGEKPANTNGIKLYAVPDASYEYSGEGTLISQLALTDVTKQAYNDYMTKTIFEPLGMTHSYFIQPPTAEMDMRIAGGYDGKKQYIQGKYFVHPELSSAGLWTTPTDICKYIVETEMSLKGQSNKVLSKEITQLRFKPAKENIQTNIDLIMGGYLYKTKGDTYFFHSGGNNGYTCLHFGSINSGRGFAIMTNGSACIQFIKEIANSIARVYNWDDFPLLPVHRTLIAFTDIEMQNYVGKYNFNGTPCKIIVKDHSLYGLIDDEIHKLYFTSATDFYIQEQWHNEYKLTPGKDGKFEKEIIRK